MAVFFALSRFILTGLFDYIETPLNRPFQPELAYVIFFS